MHQKAEIAQPVEHQFPKLKAAGSNPVFRSQLHNGVFDLIGMKRIIRCVMQASALFS